MSAVPDIPSAATIQNALSTRWHLQHLHFFSFSVVLVDFSIFPPLSNIKDRLTKPDNNHENQNCAIDYWKGDIFETVILLFFDDELPGIVVGKSENSKNNGELWDTYAGTTEGIDNIPGVAEPGGFGEDETANQSSKSVIAIIALNEDVATCTIANDKA